ncbi:MAG TPA: 16S rRNA (guanine(527)-N(7))-methyltransferase RsmG [Candidatus Deferrimicrobium sp.]|nr:16S rRNA (guanine(527)-N(7))-methyltransferase RsmG [Candidatus Deferrimicrobium sp.]
MPNHPSPDQRRALDRYLDELDLWNRRLNLTTVPREQAWTRHVEESVRLLTLVHPANASRCADLGSGGGIPGVVVAVVRPDVAVTLIEADRRKAGFLVHVCGLLELDNVTVAARRAEELAGDPDHRDAYDAVVSRAAAPALQLSALALPLLRPGASLWALVSDGDAEAAVAALAGDPSLTAAHVAPGVLAVRKAVRG